MKNRREQTEESMLQGIDEETLERFRAANKHLWGPQEMSPEYLVLLKELGYDEALAVLAADPEVGGPEG
ncbi:MAG: hypothetical protein LUE89_05075 [Clostridiales bacterium]|nr:hypothetical protein [Clostridiales bacterium]